MEPIFDLTRMEVDEFMKINVKIMHSLCELFTLNKYPQPCCVASMMFLCSQVTINGGMNKQTFLEMCAHHWDFANESMNELD